MALNFSSCLDRTGSFYNTFSESDHLIGLRNCLSALGGVIEATNFYELNTSISQYLNLNGQNVTWLMIGDSTEEIVLRETCKAFENVRVETKDSPIVSVHAYAYSRIRNRACSVRFSDDTYFMFGNLFIFGYWNWQFDESAKKIALRDSAFDNIIDTTRLLQNAFDGGFLASRFGTQKLNMISLHSCLWDENNHDKLIKNHVYKGRLLELYRQGLIDDLIYVRKRSDARIVVSTCKPLRRLDSSRETKTTRTHHLQVALDSVLFDAIGENTSLVDGVLDATRILGGYEFYAQDGRHYRTKGATTFFNQYLQFLL